MEKIKHSKEEVKKIEATLAGNVRKNILTLCERMGKGAKSTIASYCGLSSSGVSYWTSDDPSIPSTVNLYLIADLCGVSTDWLLSDHSQAQEEITEETLSYGQAFLSLCNLMASKCITPEAIKNPVLRYLAERYESYSSSTLTEDQITTWLLNILRRFTMPLQTIDYDSFDAEDIINNTPGIRAISEEDTYYNLALFMNKHSDATSEDYQVDDKGDGYDIINRQLKEVAKSRNDFSRETRYSEP